MKRFLLPLIALVLSLFATSCGDNPILDVKEVTKSDLTSPLFLAFDNTLDEPVKKIWAFNDKEAVKGTITVVTCCESNQNGTLLHGVILVRSFHSQMILRRRLMNSIK